jgi:predicted DNA-binding transcriptional regulator YafY
LECSERTVYRYLKVLEFAGIPFVYDPLQQCYRVRPDVKFPVLNLTRDELLEQATSTVIARAQGLDVGAGSAVANKLAAASGGTVAQLLADAQRVVSALDLKLADHSRHHETLRTIQWALIERQQIAGTYYSPRLKREVELTLHPYRLCLSGQAWYLIARPIEEDAPKTFRAMRFKSIKMPSAVLPLPLGEGRGEGSFRQTPNQLPRALAAVGRDDDLLPLALKPIAAFSCGHNSSRPR